MDAVKAILTDMFCLQIYILGGGQKFPLQALNLKENLRVFMNPDTIL